MGHHRTTPRQSDKHLLLEKILHTPHKVLKLKPQIPNENKQSERKKTTQSCFIQNIILFHSDTYIQADIDKYH